MIHVSRHACERWVQRVDPSMTLEQAKAEIETHASAIIAAARFGCRCVIVSRQAQEPSSSPLQASLQDHPPFNAEGREAAEGGMTETIAPTVGEILERGPRDPDILQYFTDHKLGVEFEQVRTSDDVRAEFPWMPETRWGAWPVGGSKPGMCVGATSEEALRKLREKFPHIGRIAA